MSGLGEVMLTTGLKLTDGGADDKNPKGPILHLSV